VAVTLCVLLWAHPGREADLVAYEDQVLGMVSDHGGRVLQRLRTGGAGDGPFEIHVMRFAAEDGLAGYLADERREALADLRDSAISRARILRVEEV
jgi:antibiotic biosynthesis monooxygenase (ABM) superfamily enzyme